MTKEIQFRRGSTSEHVDVGGFTGALAEVTVDTTNNTLRVHDGSTVGGHELVGTTASQRVTNKDIDATTFNTGIATITTLDSTTGNITVVNSTDINSTNINVSSASTLGSAYASSLQVANNTTINGDLYVTNNVTIGGTTTQLNTQQLLISDPDIVLGIGTTFNSTDSTANHGGLAIASTEGFPLVDLNIISGETLPNTYKKIMWFQGSSIGAGITDAWLINYAVGIGSTQVPNDIRFDVGGNLRVKYDGVMFRTKLYDLNEQVGAAGSVLISTGTATRWVKAGISTVLVTTYTSGTGTFTTNSNTLLAQVFVTGGGGGGGAADTDGSAGGAGGGGAGGGTAIKWFNREELGDSAAYSVGTAGAAGSGNGGSGGTGGTSSFNPGGTGATLSGNGGTGGTGTGSAYAPATGVFNGGNGGSASSGDINHNGTDGTAGIAPSAALLCGGNGGSSYHGGGANGPVLNATGVTVGVAATVPGAGGSGAINGNSTTSQAGGAGAAGRIIVVEYLSGGYL